MNLQKSRSVFIPLIEFIMKQNISQVNIMVICQVYLWIRFHTPGGNSVCLIKTAQIECIKRITWHSILENRLRILKFVPTQYTVQTQLEAWEKMCIFRLLLKQHTDLADLRSCIDGRNMMTDFRIILCISMRWGDLDLMILRVFRECIQWAF